MKKGMMGPYNLSDMQQCQQPGFYILAGLNSCNVYIWIVPKSTARWPIPL